MAYRFHLKAPVGKEVRRIMLEQVERAEKQLDAGAEGGADDARTAIHETRKAMKRIRALLKLVRAGLTETQYKAENARFQDVGASLAASRDRAVLIDTLRGLGARHDTILEPATSLITHLGEDAPAEKAATSIAEAREKLEATKHHIRRLRLSPDSFDVIEEGLKAGFKRALRFRATAAVTNDDEDVHSWRKAVQQHWRHMALLQRAWPDVFLARVSLARRISVLLGDDHDLSVLAATLRTLPPDALTELQRQSLLEAALADQRRYRADAHLLSSLLFAGTPRAFARQMREIWDATAALPDEARPQRPPAGRGSPA